MLRREWQRQAMSEISLRRMDRSVRATTLPTRAGWSWPTVPDATCGILPLSTMRTVGWSGECSDGFAQGSGRVHWYEDGELGQIEETRMQDGMRNGPHVLRSADGTRESEGSYMDGQRQGTWTHFYGDGTRGVGPYVNGELHGTWTYYDQDGNRMGTQRFENGRRVGGLDGPVALDHPPTVAPWAKGGQLLTRHVRRPQHRWAR